MAKDWKVKSKHISGDSVVLTPLTLGFFPEKYVYEVEDRDTGETRKVTAYDRKDLGRKLAKGKFDK